MLKQTENYIKEAQSEVNKEKIEDISEEEPDNAEDLIDRELLAELFQERPIMKTLTVMLILILRTILSTTGKWIMKMKTDIFIDIFI